MPATRNLRSRPQIRNGNRSETSYKVATPVIIMDHGAEGGWKRWDSEEHSFQVSCGAYGAGFCNGATVTEYRKTMARGKGVLYHSDGLRKDLLFDRIPFKQMEK